MNASTGWIDAHRAVLTLRPDKGLSDRELLDAYSDRGPRLLRLVCRECGFGPAAELATVHTSSLGSIVVSPLVLLPAPHRSGGTRSLPGWRRNDPDAARYVALLADWSPDDRLRLYCAVRASGGRHGERSVLVSEIDAALVARPKVRVLSV